MRNAIIGTLLTLSLSQVARAEGLRCDVLNSKLKVELRFSPGDDLTDPNSEARVMIVSDADVDAGRRTVAVFRQSKGKLETVSGRYIGQVDLRVNETARKGENLLGTKLGQVKTLSLAINTQYLDDQDSAWGRIVIEKRNGKVESFRTVCSTLL